MLPRLRSKTNPLFWPDELERLVGPERAERARTDPDSVDLLLWNVFSTLETHRDQAWLAHRLQVLGGATMSAPVRFAFWTGATREPLLRPNEAYVARIRERAERHGGSDAALADFLKPVEVPLRIEAPAVLCLVEATTGGGLHGRGGRDRFEELIDAGLDHARRQSKTLAVSVIYRSGTPVAHEVSRRLRDLQTPGAVAHAMSHRQSVPDVVLREATWEQVLRMWVAELPYLDKGGVPVRRFLDHCEERGLL